MVPRNTYRQKQRLLAVYNQTYPSPTLVEPTHRLNNPTRSGLLCYLYCTPLRVERAALHFGLEHVRPISRLQHTRHLQVRIAGRQVLLIHLERTITPCDVTKHLLVGL